MLPQIARPRLTLGHVFGQCRQEVPRDFHFIAELFTPSHTGMVAEDAEGVEGRVAGGMGV